MGRRSLGCDVEYLRYLGVCRVNEVGLLQQVTGSLMMGGECSMLGECWRGARLRASKGLAGKARAGPHGVHAGNA